MIPVVEQAAEREGGVFPEVVDLGLSALDRKTVISLGSKRTGRAARPSRSPKTCGLGAEIAAFVAERPCSTWTRPSSRITGQDITVPCKGEDHYYPKRGAGSLRGIKKIMEF